jgi:predicted DNA-binding transcriptional regulator YafY
VACWCELREDFRNFRTDRMSGLAVLDEAIPDEPGRDLEAFTRRVWEQDDRG